MKKRKVKAVKRKIKQDDVGDFFSAPKKRGVGRPKVPGPRTRMINVKAKPDLCKVFQLRADRHAGGNLSAFLRHCGLRYQFGKDEKIDPKAA